jgi:hypothetical protein
MDRGALRKAIASNGAAGFAQMALGGAGLNASQMEQAAAIAKAGFDKAPKLAGLIGGGATYAGGGSSRSGGGSSASSSGANPFGGLFGGGGKAAGPAGSDMNFGAGRTPTSVTREDIFHTGSNRNIFQIVSDRVRAVEPRLR